MTYNPGIHHRRSIRLKEFDYSSAGAYFVTICTHGRECLFGDIAGGEMRMNDAGRMVEEWWANLPGKFPDVAIDEFVVMPNHFHGIVCVGAPPCGCPGFTPPRGCLTSKTGRPHGAAPTMPIHLTDPKAAATLGDVMDWFKTMMTNAYIKGVKHLDWPPFPGRLWQRNYYERVVRDDAELSAVREYIRFNPANWMDDEEHPTATLALP